MKICITSHGQDHQAGVDTRFGRADYFAIYDEEKNTWEFITNIQNAEAAHGAGIQAGQALAKTSVKGFLQDILARKLLRYCRPNRLQCTH